LKDINTLIIKLFRTNYQLTQLLLLTIKWALMAIFNFDDG